MNYLLKSYHESCKIAFSQYGFKRKKQAFVRVENDVMQNFALERLRYGRCRVEFAIIPLCLGIEKEYISGGVYSHYLKQFEPIHWTQWDTWEYDPTSEESMDACVKEIVRYLTNYLLPLFDRANSCKTALSELIMVENLFNNYRIESLKINGIEDRANINTWIHLDDSSKYYIALKNGDFDFALKSRKALLQQNVNAYNSMSERGYLTKEGRTRRENAIVKLRDEISRIECLDESYIHQLIIENEAYSLKNLKDILRTK